MSAPRKVDRRRRGPKRDRRNRLTATDRKVDDRPDAIVLELRLPPRREPRDLGAPAVVWNLRAYAEQRDLDGIDEPEPPQSA